MDDDWLRREVEREFVVERDGWAAERVARVTQRLGCELETFIVWLADHTAFTLPGRTIYFSRRLLERLPDDDATAFVIAHELAHHRLGHVPQLSRHWHVMPIQILISVLRNRIASASHERDADLLAIEMCIQAGYEPERCIQALEQLDMIALDYGDVDGSLGTADHETRRSHPAIRRRIDDVRAHALAVAQRGHRLADELATRKRERRRRLAIVAGSSAASVLLLLLARRR